MPRQPAGQKQGGESTGTVLLAGGANLVIAVAKAVGGLLSGSTSMLSEAAHSVADTMNQVFLLTALRRSQRPPDRSHQFGYGKERYFWSLLAAVGIFVLGAGFSGLEGVRAILEPEKLRELWLAYLVLGIAFVFEGVSWLKAVRQLRGEADSLNRGAMEHLKRSNDPTVKTVAFEDTAALIGILLAALGITLHAITGLGFFDGAASVAIAVLLIGVAYALGRENKSLLIGESLDQDVQAEVCRVIADSEGVDEIVEVMTMRLSPEEVLVAARVDLADTANGEQLEHVAEEVDRRLRDEFPEIRHVFLDPTDAPTS